MKPVLLALLFLHITFLVMAQVPVKIFNETKNVDQARKLIETYQGSGAKLFDIYSNKDTSDITMLLFDKSVGYTFKLDKYSFKIVDTAAFLEFRASYIYLDGNQLTKAQIDSLRSLIISRYKKGDFFYNLVQEYSMDGSGSGDVGWFPEGMMVKSYETAVKEHVRGDIFTVDTPENNWYHVVLKTEDNRLVKKRTILKIRN